MVSLPDLTLKRLWNFPELKEQHFTALSDKFTIYPNQSVVVDTQRNQIIELPLRSFSSSHLLRQSNLLALQDECRVCLFNLRS